MGCEQIWHTSCSSNIFTLFMSLGFISCVFCPLLWEELILGSCRCISLWGMLYIREWRTWTWSIVSVAASQTQMWEINFSCISQWEFGLLLIQHYCIKSWQIQSITKQDKQGKCKLGQKWDSEFLFTYYSQVSRCLLIDLFEPVFSVCFILT